MSSSSQPPPRPHDPFPMTSIEAQRLAASVEGDTTTTSDNDPSSNVTAAPDATTTNASWNTMTTTTQHAMPIDDPMLHTSYNTERKTAPKLVVTGGSKKASAKQASGLDLELDDNDDDEDEFFDQPIWRSRQSKWVRRMLNFLEKFYQRLYGDQLPPSEMIRTLTLSLTLFCMIGGYWLFRSLKDPILTALCGVSVIPKAKMLSVVVVLCVVSIYNHLLESQYFAKHELFYVFGTFYAVVFTTIALLLMHPTIGLPNQQPSPNRILGWISYCSIESFGSVMVSLFWSFANSNISLETAKASYGVMVATAQLGSILGPTLVQTLAHTWGPAKCYLLGACCMVLLQGTMRLYIRIYGYQPDNMNQGSTTSSSDLTKTKKKKKMGLVEGIVEGLVLFYHYNYVKGIFAISCLFMVAVTIVDYTLKALATDHFASEFPCLSPQYSCWDKSGHHQHGMSEQATAAFTSFMGFFGQATNTLSLILSLFGTSAVIRKLGLRLTLLLFPSLVLLIIIIVRLHPTLYVVFAAMMTLKANSYALNNPTKEILYQPTSSNVKYKAKSWIDIFGARGSKALGSVVTNAFSDSTSHVISNGTLVGMVVASFLIWNATFMGRKFDEYTHTGYVVGRDNHNDSDPYDATKPNDNNDDDRLPQDEDEAELVNVDKASKQNQGSDTSCALPLDDDEDGDEKDDQLGVQEEGQDESEHGSTSGSPAKNDAHVTMV